MINFYPHNILHMKKIIAVFCFLLCFGFQFAEAQLGYHPQRRTRGYVPPMNNQPRAIRAEKDIQKELDLIVPICSKEFQFDDFEKEIFKQLLAKKIEEENRITLNEDLQLEDKRKNYIQIDKNFQADLATIMTPDEIEQFGLMNFNKEEREKKKDKRRKKKKKGKS